MEAFWRNRARDEKISCLQRDHWAGNRLLSAAWWSWNHAGELERDLGLCRPAFQMNWKIQPPDNCSGNCAEKVYCYKNGFIREFTSRCYFICWRLASACAIAAFRAGTAFSRNSFSMRRPVSAQARIGYPMTPIFTSVRWEV